MCLSGCRANIALEPALPLDPFSSERRTHTDPRPSVPRLGGCLIRCPDSFRHFVSPTRGALRRYGLGRIILVRVLMVPMIAKGLFVCKCLRPEQKRKKKRKKKLFCRYPAAGYTIYSCRGGRKLFAKSRREFVMIVMEVAESRPRSNEGCEANWWCKRKSRQPAQSVDLPLVK